MYISTNLGERKWPDRDLVSASLQELCQAATDKVLDSDWMVGINWHAAKRNMEVTA